MPKTTRTLIGFCFILFPLAIPGHSQEPPDPRDDPGTYMAIASELQNHPERIAELRAALERGIKVSVRDRDMARAAFFANQLQSAGGSSALSLVDQSRSASGAVVVVPGGMKALMVVARGRAPESPERFFAEYARTVLNQYSVLGPGRNGIVDRIKGYFERIRALQALGVRSGPRVTLSLSGRDENGRQRAAQVLDLLGWRLEMHDGRAVVSTAEDPSKSTRQVTALALELDELAMQSALQAGGSFDFAITDDTVPVLLNERTWLEQWRYPDFPGGFADALAREVRFANTYAGLSELDVDTTAALVSGVGLKRLCEDYTDRLYHFSSAFAVIGSRVVVPGGNAALPVWEKLVDASPLRPGEFFRALLEADEGKLLAYFFTLSQLDWAHQQFFTRSPSRTARFYDIFKNSIGVRGAISRGLRECPFADFLSDVPLDGNGQVVFPGGREVWLVAKGHGSVRDTERLFARVSETETSDVEDEILVRLARTHYGANGLKCSELDNFLAVARVDAHRSRPLDARSALLLAQQYNRYRSIWPYFSIFTGLGYEEYSEFFALGERLRGYARLRANDYLGQLGSLLEIISLLHQSGKIDERQVTGLFRLLCGRFASTGSEQFGAAALEVTRELLKEISGRHTVDNPDAMMVDLLAGVRRPVSFAWRGRNYEVDDAALRRNKFEQILQLQHVPGLGPLFRIQDLLQGVRNGPREDLLAQIDAEIAGLPVVETPESLQLRTPYKENLERFRTDRLRKLAADMRRAGSERRNVESAIREMTAAMSPHVRLALSGIVYACYLDPEDLLVSDDPLFLRKHQFVSLRLKLAALFSEHDLARDPESGSSIVGSFAGFGLMAGKVAVTAAYQNEGGSEFYSEAQLASLRIDRWAMVHASDADLRSLALKIRLAREWVIESALNAEVRSGLLQSTLGLLSLTRRSHLLRSLGARDWSAAWRSLTLSDLYHLGNDFLRRYPNPPWPSPTIHALRRLDSRNGLRPDWLGQDLQYLMSCSHPHLVRLAPYERYEQYLLPMQLAERTSEFKFYMAEFIDRLGISAQVLDTLAEPLARTVLRELRLTDRRDWRTVLDSFSRLDESILERVLSKPWPDGLR